MKIATYSRLVLISLATLGPGSACNDHKTCILPGVDLSTSAPVDAAQPPIDFSVPPVDIKVDLSSITTDCSPQWKSSGPGVTFSGTEFLNNCNYGYSIECVAYVKNPVDMTSVADKPLRFEVQHQYQLVSGVDNQPLLAPTDVRILRGEVRVYDQDPQVNPTSLLGSWAITGAQTSFGKTGFYLAPTSQKNLYFTFYTRLDCSKYPPPQSQTWSWTINSLHIFQDKEPVLQ